MQYAVSRIKGKACQVLKIFSNICQSKVKMSHCKDVEALVHVVCFLLIDFKKRHPTPHGGARPISTGGAFPIYFSLLAKATLAPWHRLLLPVLRLFPSNNVSICDELVCKRLPALGMPLLSLFCETLSVSLLHTDLLLFQSSSTPFPCPNPSLEEDILTLLLHFSNIS